MMIVRVHVFVRALKIVFKKQSLNFEAKLNVFNNSLDGGCPFTTFLYFPASLLLPVFVKVFLHFEIKKQVGDC